MPFIIHVMPSSCLTKSGLSLGIDRVEGEMLPEQKHEVIKRLQDEGKIVAMAGYGINDAPALSQAHVGIGMISWPSGSPSILVLRSTVSWVPGNVLWVAAARAAIDLDSETLPRIGLKEKHLSKIVEHTRNHPLSVRQVG